MIKKFTIILITVLLLTFSCKSGGEVKAKPEVGQTEVETSIDETQVATGSTEKEKPKQKATPKKTQPQRLAPKQPEPKKPSTQKTEPKKLQPKQVQPKVDPQKVPAETALKRANSLMSNCTDAGVDKSFPKEFESAKKDLNSAETSAKNKNYAEAKTFAENSSLKFETLLNLNDAQKTKNDVVKNKFEGSDAKGYSNAEIAYMKSIESFDVAPNQALGYSKSAANGYSIVLEKGYVAWTNIAKQNASKAKTNCDSIKASKSATSEYGRADKLFKDGVSQQASKNYKQAHASFTTATEQFTVIYDKVSVLRAEALKAMERASNQQKLSSELASEADIIIPITEDKIESSPIIENAPEDAGLEQ